MARSRKKNQHRGWGQKGCFGNPKPNHYSEDEYVPTIRHQKGGKHSRHQR